MVFDAFSTSRFENVFISVNIALSMYLQGKETEEEDDVAVNMEKDRFMDEFFVQVSPRFV